MGALRSCAGQDEWRRRRKSASARALPHCLPLQVEAGRNVAVYADEDDINKNGYYLLQVGGH